MREQVTVHMNTMTKGIKLNEQYWTIYNWERNPSHCTNDWGFMQHKKHRHLKTSLKTQTCAYQDVMVVFLHTAAFQCHGRTTSIFTSDPLLHANLNAPWRSWMEKCLSTRIHNNTIYALKTQTRSSKLVCTHKAKNQTASTMQSLKDLTKTEHVMAKAVSMIMQSFQGLQSQGQAGLNNWQTSLTVETILPFLFQTF